MTLDEAIRRNPYNPERGNKSAYCRYLRYNVDGWYQLDSKEVLRIWQKTRITLLEELAEEDLQVLSLAYLYAKHLQMYGEDITKAISSATANAAMLNKAYRKGYYDGMNGADQLAITNRIDKEGGKG